MLRDMVGGCEMVEYGGGEQTAVDSFHLSLVFIALSCSKIINAIVALSLRLSGRLGTSLGTSTVRELSSTTRREQRRRLFMKYF